MIIITFVRHHFWYGSEKTPIINSYVREPTQLPECPKAFSSLSSLHCIFSLFALITVGQKNVSSWNGIMKMCWWPFAMNWNKVNTSTYIPYVYKNPGSEYVCTHICWLCWVVTYSISWRNKVLLVTESPTHWTGWWTVVVFVVKRAMAFCIPSGYDTAEYVCEMKGETQMVRNQTRKLARVHLIAVVWRRARESTYRAVA